MNNFTTTPNVIDGNWYRIILIEEDPFIVIGAQPDFSIGRIEIYSAVWYSIKEASEKFNEKKEDLKSNSSNFSSKINTSDTFLNDTILDL